MRQITQEVRRQTYSVLIQKIKMLDVLKYVQTYYKYVVYDIADPRTNDFWLTYSPWIPFGIAALYIMTIKKILPDFMRNREAMKLDKLILFYNFTQIFYNSYLLYTGLATSLKMNFFCANVDHTDNSESRLFLNLTYWYFILKLYDLLDTCFFILRKKDEQVTYLHVYHHCFMIFITWIGLRYVPGGNTIFVGLCNTTVHIVMYFYYGIALRNSGAKKNIWWKKHLTQLQLAQFTILFIMLFSTAVQPSCGYPKFLSLLGATQNLYFLYLFGSFYYKAYVVTPKGSSDQKRID